MRALPRAGLLASSLNAQKIWFVLLGIVIVVFPFLDTWPFFEAYIGPFRTFQATMVGVWLMVTLGMNLLTGYSGQISLGHAALVLVGGFTAAVLVDQYALPLAAAVFLGALFTGLIGFLLGFPTVRLSGPYLAIATLAMVLALPQILKIDRVDRWTNATRGGINPPEFQAPGFIGGWLDQDQWLYFIVMFSAVVMTVLAWNIMRSRMGRAFIALRDSEVGAVHMGVHLPLYKALAFGVSAFYAGLGGGLWFMVNDFIGPDSVDLLTSIKFLVAIVIGGLASILGSVFGAMFLAAENDIIDLAGKVIPQADTLRQAIFGTILIVTMVLFPRGLAGFTHGLVGWRPGRARQPGQTRSRLQGYLGVASRIWRRLAPGRTSGAKKGRE